MNFKKIFFSRFLTCVLITISGSITSKRGFSVSKKLPDPLGYHGKNLNPVLETLADQTNQDPLRPPGHLTGLQLRDYIVLTLNNNSLKWPMNFGYLTKSQWIKCIKQDTSFYRAHNSLDYQAHESLLLHLASQLLKRKICLISLFPEDKDVIIEPPMPTPSKPYYLFGCNKAMKENFYVSVFKKNLDHEFEKMTFQ